MQDSDQALQQEILDFWFGLPASAEYGKTRDVWFRKDDEFDAAIRRRFGAAVDRAIAGEFTTWDTEEKTVSRRDDARLIPVERWFLYMPFVHTESAANQARSVQLFTRLRDETGLAEPLDWAHRHAEVIRRFGRYPNRNAILGRESTPKELEFLAQPRSGF